MGYSAAIEGIGDYLGSISATTYAAAASTAATVGSAVVQANAQEKANAYQAQVASNNQKTAEANAEYSLQVGDTKVAAKQQQTSQMLGAERAGLAASGVDLDSGSPLRLQKDTATLGQVDADTIRSNAARDAYGYRTQGLNFGIVAQQDRTAGNLDAFGDILTGASSVAGKWAAYKNNGTF